MKTLLKVVDKCVKKGYNKYIINIRKGDTNNGKN